MSFYKDQLKTWLADKTIEGGDVLSVGNLNDDSKYFKSFKCDEIITLDIVSDFGANVIHDMNLPISSDPDTAMLAGAFDHMFTFELWEYIYNPVVALQNCNALLKEGGKLWISAPFIYPTHNPIDADFLRYTEHFWHKLLPDTGFTILEYNRRVWKESQYFIQAISNDGMRPSKEYRHHDITGHLILAEKHGESTVKT